MRRAVLIGLMVTACTGVSQSEFEAVQERLDEARDQLAATEVESADLVRAEAVVGSYVGATDPYDLDALTGVYAIDVRVFDTGRGLLFRTRGAALADLALGQQTFGILGQRTLSTVVTAELAVVEWEMYGVDGIGLDWSFRGTSVLEFSVDGSVGEERLYYNEASAPWGR